MTPVLALALALLQAPSAPKTPAAPAGPALTPPQVAAALHDYLAASSTGFSGAVLLAKGDDILLREAYGLASRENHRQNRPETRFNVGSINKAFTRIAIEQLAAAGTLSLDDTLDRWVPEYPVEKGRRITLRQLLEHRAGTGDIFGPRYDGADHSKLLTLRDWLPLIAETPLSFEPGAREEYSNAGYLLLGLVIEKASGQSYYDYVRDRVFGPAGMKDTGSFTLAEGGDSLAIGYTKEGGTLEPNRATLPARGTSAGGGYSTVDDLRRFARWMPRSRPGAGLMMMGGAPGINAALIVEGDWTAVVLANLDPPAAQSVAQKIEGWLRGPGAPPRGAPRRVVIHGGDDDFSQGRPKVTFVPEDGVDAPLDGAGHMATVDVMIDGQGPFRFAMDTGGAGTLRVNQELADKLSLPRVGEVQAGDPSGRNQITMPLVAVKELTLGGARFEELVAGTRNPREAGLPDMGVDGILGCGLFADALLTLDYPAGRLRIERGELPADAPGVMPFTSDEGIPSVTITVAGKPIRAHVDAGSMGGILLPRAEAEGLPLASPLTVVGHARTVSNSFEIEAAPLAGDVVFAGITLTNPMVAFQPIMPFANVGSRVLKDLVLTFDQKNHLLRVVRP